MLLLLLLLLMCSGIVICLIRDLLPKRAAKWVPSPMAMSIPFYIGAASVSDGLGVCFLFFPEPLNGSGLPGFGLGRLSIRARIA